ncbi:autotransporter beta-domain protein, partial [Chlamydia psittaci 02DC22]
TPASDLDF